jgi:hypothetical protein
MSKQFLGRGWRYPVETDGDGFVSYSEDEDKIRESIFIILGTAHGERVMRPEFGSRLSELVFASVNSSTLSLVTHYVTSALVQWEPRVDVVEVKAQESTRQTGLLNIHLHYRIRATNSMYNLVYPFYLERESKVND